MSASTSIDLRYVVQGDPPQFVIEFFDRLLDGGWGLEGDVRHLALGDVDDFDWIRTRMTRDEAVALVGEKRRRNEQPGLQLFTAEGSHGAEFLEVEPGVISLINTNDVVALKTNRMVADPSWYLAADLDSEVRWSAVFELVEWAGVSDDPDLLSRMEQITADDPSQDIRSLASSTTPSVEDG